MPRNSSTGQRAYERAADRIQQLIQSGEMMPGGKLPPERRLAEEFGLSRSSVREAIRLLSEQGVLEARQGAGTFIRKPEAAGFESKMAEALTHQRLRLWHIFEFRRMLEPRLARAAAECVNDDVIKRLQDTIVRQDQALSSGESGSAEDLEFHKIIAEATKNPVAVEALNTLGNFIAESRSESLSTPRRKKASLDSHLRVLSAIRMGDGDRAEQEMERHLIEVEKTIFGDDIEVFVSQRRNT